LKYLRNSIMILMALLMLVSSATAGTSYDIASNSDGSDIKDMDKKADWVVATVLKKGMTDREKALALHNWIINNTYYDINMWYGTAYDVLITGCSVCSGYAEAYSLLLTKAGIPNKYLVGETYGGLDSWVVLPWEEEDDGWDSHAWNLVRINGQWYHVDTTWDDPVVASNPFAKKSGQERTTYFMLTDSQIRKDHRWDKGISADKNKVGEFNHPATVDGIKYLLNMDGTAEIVSGTDREKLKIPDTIKVEKKNYTVTRIGKKAFKGCTKLKTLITGDKLQYIEEYAFSSCKKLKNVTLGKNVCCLEGAFEKCSSLTSISLSPAQSEVYENTFAYCTKLSKVKFNKELRGVRDSGFQQCTSLRSIVLPYRVTLAGSKAFYGCSNLSTIRIESMNFGYDYVESDAFKGISPNATIYLPKEKFQEYKELLLKSGMTKKMKFKTID